MQAVSAGEPSVVFDLVVLSVLWAAETARVRLTSVIAAAEARARLRFCILTVRSLSVDR